MNTSNPLIKVLVVDDQPLIVEELCEFLESSGYRCVPCNTTREAIDAFVADSEIGLVLPVVRIRDNLRLQPQAYRIKIRGQEIAHGELMLERLLAIPGSETDEELKGITTTEPAFGLPAFLGGSSI